MPAKLEEVVLDADPRKPQHLGKQPAQQRLLRVARRPLHMAGRHKLRRRQRTPVELAVRRQRQPIQHHNRRRHHVLRQHLRQRRTKPMRLRRRRTRAAQPHSRSAAGRPPRRPAPPPPPAPRPHARSSTASISPGSIRNPRSFTCASARPRNSSTPSARHRARSPVRYIRAPGPPSSAPCGSATNRSAVRPGTVQIPPRQPHPRHVKLANNPRRHRLQAPHPEHRPGSSGSDGRSGTAGAELIARATPWATASIVASVGPYRLVIRPSLTMTRNLLAELAGEGFAAERQMIQRRIFGRIVASTRFEKRRHATDERHADRARAAARIATGDSRTASLTTTAAPPPIKGSNACSIDGSNAEEIRSAARKRSSTSKSRPSAEHLVGQAGVFDDDGLRRPVEPEV